MSFSAKDKMPKMTKSPFSVPKTKTKFGGPLVTCTSTSSRCFSTTLLTDAPSNHTSVFNALALQIQSVLLLFLTLGRSNSSSSSSSSSRISCLCQAWTDEHLTWEPDEYDGIVELLVSPKKVWLPDIGIENRFCTFAWFSTHTYQTTKLYVVCLRVQNPQLLETEL